jgi:hypothetical protein
MLIVIIATLQERKWCINGVDKEEWFLLLFLIVLALMDTLFTGTLIYFLIK